MLTTVSAMDLVVIALGIGVCRIVGDGGFFVSYSGIAVPRVLSLQC